MSVRWALAIISGLHKANNNNNNCLFAVTCSVQGRVGGVFYLNF